MTRRVALVAAVLGLVLSGVPAARPVQAVTLVQDPERNSQALAGWGWHNGQTPSVINSWISSSGQRPIDIEVDSPATSPPKFSVAYVANSGAYARTWWWYYGLTASQVSSYLSTNGARLIDIEPYVDGTGNLRFAVIMVANSGAAQKSWWWYVGQTVSDISARASSLGARPIDVDRYVYGGVTRFTVIFIKNTGVDAKGWGHLYNTSLSSIVSWASTNHMRILDLERIPGTSNYDAVFQGLGTEYWWWTSGRSATSLGYFASQKGARIYKIEPYYVGSTKYFAALLINDVNAETTRIRQLVSSKMTGSWGFYLKKIGGAEVLGLQPDRIFEPASMIKILHAVRALREVQYSHGTVSLTTNVTWYANPDEPARYPSDPDYNNPDGTPDDPKDKDVCAYDGDGTLLTGATYSDDLGGVIIKQMLGYSDNRTTDALTRRYGFTSLNNLASNIGMSRTHLYHRVGCPRAASPQPWHHNELTLRDAGKIYEGAENGVWLDSTRRTALNGYLVGGRLSNVDPTNPLIVMIKDEARKAGLTTTEQSSFLFNAITRSKGGSYSMCPDSGACDPATDQHRTVGGALWLPFKNGSGTIVPTTYVFGRFFNVTVNCTFDSVTNDTCTAYNNEADGNTTIAVEMFRQVVKQALATW